MRALVVSNFPSGTNEGKLRKELESRGVDVVDFVESNRFVEAKLGVVDTVILMKDLVSHSHSDRVKTAAKKSGRKFIPIERKSSGWDEKIGPVKQEEKLNGGEMAPPKSVKDEDMNGMLNEYIRMFDSGASEEEMVKGLQKFWTGRPLTNSKQLNQYMLRLNDKAPPFFAKWLEGKNQEQVEESKQNNEDIKDNKEHPKNIQSSLDEMKEIQSLYEEENRSLRAEVDHLKTVNAELEKFNDLLDKSLSSTRNELSSEKLRRENSEVKLLEASKTQTSGKVKEAIFALAKLVELGMMEPSEAFQKIVKIA